MKSTSKIPQQLKDQIEEEIQEFNRLHFNGKKIGYCARFEGKYLYLDRLQRAENSPICRLKYNGRRDNWSFAIFKYSSETYSTGELFPGMELVDGTVEGAMAAGLAAYPSPGRQGLPGGCVIGCFVFGAMVVIGSLLKLWELLSRPFRKKNAKQDR